MFGFIYIWRDKKHNKYYVGSHWGTENDGYICSSDSMKKAHRRRPGDFKRRIVSRVTTNRKDLLEEEQRWLDMIKLEEFGRRYYNISSKVHKSFWWVNAETKKQVSEKISKKLKEKYKNNPEFIKKTSKHSKLPFITNGIKDKKLKINETIPEGWWLGRSFKMIITEKSKQSISLKMKQKWNDSFYRKKTITRMKEVINTSEYIANVKAARNKPEVKAKCNISMLGKKHTPEWKENAKKLQRKRRDSEMINNISKVLNPKEIYKNCNYKIGKVMKQTGLSRREVVFMLQYYNIERI